MDGLLIAAWTLFVAVVGVVLGYVVTMAATDDPENDGPGAVGPDELDDSHD